MAGEAAGMKNTNPASSFSRLSRQQRSADIASAKIAAEADGNDVFALWKYAPSSRSAPKDRWLGPRMPALRLRRVRLRLERAGGS